jgi:ribosomal protein S18 acetylase RimI-like enzyme
MQIHNLQNTPIDTIAECFNKAFATYFVPIKLDSPLLRDKIKSENILLEHSIGVTIDNQLAGFILIGIDKQKNIAYNAGTGVIPEYRGQKLTEKMYPFLLSNLKKIEIHHHLLEVICGNLKAIRIYEKLGYFVLRKVICYKGKVSEPNNYNYKIEAIALPDETKVKLFWNHYPTYQNSTNVIKNNPEKHSAFGSFDNEKLIGYIIFDKNTLRVKQFGIDNAFRNKGLGHQLFYEVQNQLPEKEITLINIDDEDFETNDFLRNIGFKTLIEQYEMELKTY